jgi:hypothetical protein
MLLTTLALAIALAPAAAMQPPTAPAATAPAAPKSAMSVRVEAAASAGAPVQKWAQELRTALEARKDEFRLARTGEKAELVFKVDSVAAAPNGGNVMNGALVMGAQVKPFGLTYPGEIRPQAEAFARNLRKLAEQMKTAPPPPATKKK